MDKKLVCMPSLEQKLLEIKDIFSIFDDSLDKFSQIIDMGKHSPGLDEVDKNNKNKINGCTSQAWVKCDKKANSTFRVQTDSDAFIVRGLLNILERLLDGRTSKEILSIDSKDILENIGLDKNITSQRTNGFLSAVIKIHTEVKKLDSAK